MVNYGIGTRGSEAPADLILSLADPTDVTTWTYYDRDSFIYAVWKNLVFSVRSKAMPKNYTPYNKEYAAISPWVRRLGGSYMGALHVRV